MRKIIKFTPLFFLVFICLFFLLFIIFEKDPNSPPSALINKEIPKFTTTSLFNKNIKLSSDNIKRNVNLSENSNVNFLEDSEAKYTLINFFASWCAPCKVEHPLFFEIKKEFPELLIIGFSHKDKLEDTIKYLSEEGNPYSLVAKDFEGSVGFEFGVFGLPETFLINKEGKIIYKHIGPITKKIIFNEIKPLF